MTRAMALTTEDVWHALERVVDPEIPAVSVVDLGIVEEVVIDEDRVRVTCLPTFSGCPALEVIREDIEIALEALGAKPEVQFTFSPPWTTVRITAEGHRKLREYGLSPPERSQNPATPLTLLAPGRCPYCDSTDTVLESPFGPTLCRATCYCRSCRNPFEKFKEV